MPNCSAGETKLRRLNVTIPLCSAVHMLPTRCPVLQLLKQRRRRPVEVAQRTSYD